MNKSEWMWVSIRITGLAFLVMTVVAIPDAISGIYTAILYSEMTTGSGTPVDTAMQNIIKAGRANAVNSVIQAILYSVSSIYFIKRGKLAHDILCRE